MELPPLPDIFGNYAIRGIVEVLPPGPISWFPSTIGWKLLLAMLLAATGYRLWKYWRYWRRNRYRAAALANLKRYRAENLAPEVELVRIAGLLKATALQVFPRQEIASLSGENWLQWLDESTERVIFSAPSRELLRDALYRGTAPDTTIDLATLCRESADWIRGHREPMDA
jgi:hypothetical protein